MAVEPVASPVITQTRAGEPVKPAPHKIQGIGAGFVPKNLDLSLVDRVEQISNEEAVEFARRWRAKKESSRVYPVERRRRSRFVWQSCRNSRGKTIVTVLPDSGERYLSTILFEGIGQ